MTISGGRPRQMTRGSTASSVNDLCQRLAGKPALGVNLGVDAVEQFTVLTSNYPAQVGRSFWRSGRCFHAVGNGTVSMEMYSSSCRTVRWTREFL